MKSKVLLIGALALAGQLAFADGEADGAQPAAQEASNSAAAQPVEKVVTDKQIKALERDLSPSLQMMLDEQMSFDFGPLPETREVVASTN